LKIICSSKFGIRFTLDQRVEPTQTRAIEVVYVTDFIRPGQHSPQDPLGEKWSTYSGVIVVQIYKIRQPMYE